MCIGNCIGNYDFLTQTKGKSYKAYRYWGASWTNGNGRILTAAHRSGPNSVWNKRTKTIRVRPSQNTGGDTGLHSWIAKKRCMFNGRVYGEIVVSGTVSVFGLKPPKKDCPTCHTRHVIPVKGKGRPTGYLSTQQTIVRLFVPRALQHLVPHLRERYKVPVRVVAQ